MRLIDADELEGHIKILGIWDEVENKDVFTNDIKDAILKLIDAQPTAYDPDKVVEQLYGLKKYGNKYDSYWDSSLYHMTEIENKTINDVVEKAIEIVKGGGVDVN